MYIFLHNARCSKSNEALKLMEKAGKKYILREYLKSPLDIDELQDLQEKLWKSAIQFTRTNEKEFKEQGLTKDSSDIQILKKMAAFPKLMERPIVYSDTKAFIGRPAEEILKIFRK
mgnify:CR=1 FL=1